MSTLNVNNITKYTGGEVVVNDASEDVDFRVESDGSTHAVFVDAGSDAVLIGKSGNNDTDAGVRHTTAGYTSIVCSGDTPLTVNRLASDGAIINIQQASATIAQLETEGTSLEIKTAGNNAIVIDNTGAVTKPLQPAFLAHAALQSNVTGNNDDYTTQWTGSEVFDQNADFDGTSTFTAPVTGKYYFNVFIYWTGITTDHTSVFCSMAASNRYCMIYGGNGNASPAAAGELYIHGSFFVDMDASDTIVVNTDIRGGSKVADINTASFFSGHLVC